MWMLVTSRNTDGTYDEVGMNKRWATSKYISVYTLLRYSMPKSMYAVGFRVQDEKGYVLYESPTQH